MSKICTYCNKPIVLNPSASERARKYGGKPSDYINLFTMHNTCQVKKREADTLELIRRKNSESNAKRILI